jgi:hypothetical protein
MPYPPVDRTRPSAGSIPGVSRRSAIGRLFGLGVAATAAVALPAPVQAVPMAPEPAIADPEILQLFQGFERALPLVSEDLQELTRSILGRFVRSLEVRAGLREPAPIAVPIEPEPPRVVAQERIVTIRFGKLDRNARRRAYRWIGRHYPPSGFDGTHIRYRIGRRGADAGWDYLDVAVPAVPADRGWVTPHDYAHQVLREMGEAIRRPSDTWPIIGARQTLCSHTDELGGPFLLAYRDGSSPRTRRSRDRELA